MRRSHRLSRRSSRVDDATVVYPGGHVALERLSLEIDRGEFAFIVGPTGCGKSTLIKMLIREIEPAAGTVQIAGKDINEMPADRTPYLRRRIGTVFQDFKLLPNRTVYDNVAYALQVIGEPRSQIRRKVPEILRLVGLQAKIHNYPDELSGGEQQRVAIARAFVNHPPLLLADEPTGNLDPETSIGIMQLLYRINRTGTTVLVVTHDREMVDKMRRRVIALEEGRLVRDEAAGGYHEDESTTEFAARVRAEMGVGDEGGTNGTTPRDSSTEPMGRVVFFLSEAFRALRRSAAPSVAAIVTIVVTTLLLGVLVPVLRASESKATEVRDQIGLKVFLYRRRDASAEIDDAGGEARRASRTSTASTYCSPECAKKDLQTRVEGDLESSIDELNSNPLPPSFNLDARRPRQPRGGARRRCCRPTPPASRRRSAPRSTRRSARAASRRTRSARSPARSRSSCS